MKPIALSLAIAAAAFGASTLYLSLQLHQERLQADELATQSRELHARIAELEATRAGRDMAGANPFSPVMTPPGSRTGRHAHVEETPAVEADLMNGVDFNAPPRSEEFFNKMMRSQVRAHNKQLYLDIGARLGLSKDDANKLIDLLTEQQLHTGMSWNDLTGPDSAWQLMAEKERQNKAQIAELIGTDKANSFAEYQQSLPARQELDMLARQLDGADAPLTEEQQKRLIDVFVEERLRIPAPTLTDATSLEEHTKASLTWQANYEENVASRTRAILNSEQLSTYNEYREWHTQMRTQMGEVHAGGIHPVPGKTGVMFTTSMPAVSADLVVELPAEERSRK
jgi:hypothetical protein